MLPVFTYGTLMYQPLWLKIVEHQSLPIPAVVNDFCRCRIINALSCSLVPAAGGHVAGMLYGGLAESGLEKLDRYTQDLFERVQLQVVTPCEKIMAYTYIIRPEAFNRIDLVKWDQRRFEHFGLRHLLASPAADMVAVV